MALKTGVGRTIARTTATVPGKKLPVTHHAQAETEWCWAACAEMVFDYYAVNPRAQCDTANYWLGMGNCCSNPVPAACKQPCSHTGVGRIYAHGGVKYTFHSTSVPFADLQNEINADRPVEVSWTWNGGGAHLVLVYGWKSPHGGTDKVLVHDPDVGSRSLDYADLTSAGGLGKWDWTWTDLEL